MAVIAVPDEVRIPDGRYLNTTRVCNYGPSPSYIDEEQRSTTMKI